MKIVIFQSIVATLALSIPSIDHFSLYLAELVLAFG